MGGKLAALWEMCNWQMGLFWVSNFATQFPVQPSNDQWMNLKAIAFQIMSHSAVPHTIDPVARQVFKMAIDLTVSELIHPNDQCMERQNLSLFFFTEKSLKDFGCYRISVFS